MSVRINTNIEALNAQRNLSSTASVFARSVEKLSSGLRINRAADDSAGLAISEKLKAQVTGLNQAQRNAQDGVSMVQTAEGALTEVHSMLQRIRELAVEAANSTLSSTDARSVSTEISALKDEINRIGNSTVFNGQHLLTGVMSVAQSGGTVTAGKSLNTGQNATLLAVDVSGAQASTTYTITSQAGGKVTLSDGVHSQQVTLAPTIGATNAEAVNFDSLGVKLTVAGDSAKTAGNLAADLATGALGPSTIGGAAPSDLVIGDVIAQTDNTPAISVGTTYTPLAGGLDTYLGPLSGTASSGVAQGTMVVAVNGVSGAITGSVGGENFAGTLDPAVDGDANDVTLTGSRGNTITLHYTQGTPANWAQQAADMNGASFTFVAGTRTAAVTAMTAPTATAGSYTFTSSGPGSLTLSGPGGTQTIAVAGMAGAGSQTLNFSTIGVSFTLTASGSGFTAAAIVSNLLQPANDTIVVSAGAVSPATIATGAGSNANFQIGANAGDFLHVSFQDARTSNTDAAHGYGALDAVIAAFDTATSSGNGIVAAAQALISAVDIGIGYVSTVRGNLGAVQNRLEHTTASIAVASENLNASESRIRDLDVASEMVNFTKTQILQQAGTAILAQANSAPQNILTLLR